MSNESNIVLSKLDWAAIYLFSKVKDNLIDKILKRWIDTINKDNSTSKILKRNVISAFLNLIGMFDDRNQFEENEKQFLVSFFNDYGFEEDSCVDIKYLLNDKVELLLKEKGYLLFNFYVYKIVESEEDKYLNPFVVGLDHILKSYNNFNSIYSVLNACKIPFRIYNSQDFLNTYRNQLLPINGGLTPFYTLQYLESNFKKPLIINNFLSHLSLLHKREDYMQGHFSAILRVILNHKTFGKKKDGALFTAVMTSVMPNAFNEQDEVDFDEILNLIENLGNFVGFNRISGFQHTLVTYEIIKVEYNIFNDLLNDNQNITDLHIAEIKSVFKQENNHNLIFINNEFSVLKNPAHQQTDKQQEWFRIAKTFAININSFENIINKIFPTGPWFEKQVFNIEGINNYDKLSKYNDSLKKAFLEDNFSCIEDQRPLKDFFEILLPENFDTKAPNLIRSEIDLPVNNGTFKLIFYTHNCQVLNKDSKFYKEAFNLSIIITDIINKHTSGLDGQNQILLSIYEEWLGFMSSKDNNRNFSYNKDVFLTQEFIENMRCIFVIEEQSIFIPDIKDSTKNFFKDYQEFWTFQILFSTLYKSKLNLNDFERYNNTPKYLYCADSSDIILYLGNDESQNTILKKGILYFGIDIGNIIFSKSNKSWIKFKNKSRKYGIDEFNDFYKDYIFMMFREIQKSNIIKFVCNDEMHSIVVNIVDDGKINVIINDDYNIEWIERKTLKPSLSLINYNDINNYYKNNLDNSKMELCTKCHNMLCKTYSKGWNHERNSVNDKTLFCNLNNMLNNIFVQSYRILKKRQQN